MLVWDGLNTHTSRAMRELIAARDWLTVFQLPAYAPERESGQPGNQLTALVKTRLRRMQYRPGPLEGFLAKTRLDLTTLQ